MIYFITDGNTVGSSYVKIGYTESDVSRRLGDLQVGNPLRLGIAWEIPGDRVLEKQLHRYFGIFRVSGEWFTCTKEYSEMFAILSDTVFRIVELSGEENMVRHLKNWLKTTVIWARNYGRSENEEYTDKPEIMRKIGIKELWQNLSRELLDLPFEVTKGGKVIAVVRGGDL